MGGRDVTVVGIGGNEVHPIAAQQLVGTRCGNLAKAAGKRSGMICM